jgi:hypothetical protein
MLLTDSLRWPTGPQSWAGPLQTCSLLPSSTMQVRIAKYDYCHLQLCRSELPNMSNVIFNYAGQNCQIWVLYVIFNYEGQNCQIWLLPSSTMQVRIAKYDYCHLQLCRSELLNMIIAIFNYAGENFQTWLLPSSTTVNIQFGITKYEYCHLQLYRSVLPNVISAIFNSAGQNFQIWLLSSSAMQVRISKHDYCHLQLHLQFSIAKYEYCHLQLCRSELLNVIFAIFNYAGQNCQIW